MDAKTERRKRFTIVEHNYLGYNFYVIGFRRVLVKESQLGERMKDCRYGTPHFSLPGWPRIEFPDGDPYFEKDGAK